MTHDFMLMPLISLHLWQIAKRNDQRPILFLLFEHTRSHRVTGSRTRSGERIFEIFLACISLLSAPLSEQPVTSFIACFLVTHEEDFGLAGSAEQRPTVSFGLERDVCSAILLPVTRYRGQ